MPWLMLLLVAGTIAQRYIGLFQAEKLFFKSYWLWIGGLPVPSVYPTLALLTFGVTLKLLFKSKWNFAQGGILLTHLGVLLLLLGGWVTALTSEEGYLTLTEGEQGRVVADYHQRDLVVFEGDFAVREIPFETLKTGQQVPLSGLPFALQVKDSCRNCMPQMREEADERTKGIAEKLSLKSIELDKNDEANLTGLTLELSGVSDAANGEYILFEAMPRPIEFEMAGKSYKIFLQKSQRALPFMVRLNAFRKFTHPGTQMAKEYESDVTIVEPSGVEWSQTIRMNEPLRTHGYTLYQSSFLEAGGRQASVLAVVKNKGYLFPYIASIIMAIGLIWHSYLHFQRRKSV